MTVLAKQAGSINTKNRFMVVLQNPVYTKETLQQRNPDHAPIRSTAAAGHERPVEGSDVVFRRRPAAFPLPGQRLDRRIEQNSFDKIRIAHRHSFNEVALRQTCRLRAGHASDDGTAIFHESLEHVLN